MKSAAAVEQDGDKPRAAAGRSLDDWTYHGIGRRVAADGRTHILVEDTAFGPTARQGITVLRELPEPSSGGFYWGYDGSGPYRAAAAILADTLSLSDPDARGVGPAASPRDTTFSELCSDFCWDVLTQLCEEWRMRRGAVLRWVRGWYAEHGIADLPQAAVQPPSACPLAPAPRPGRLPGPADGRLGPLPTAPHWLDPLEQARLAGPGWMVRRGLADVAEARSPIQHRWPPEHGRARSRSS